MRRAAVALIAFACACNLLTGVGDLDPSGVPGPCPGCDGPDARAIGDDEAGAIDSPFVSDVQKDGDDDSPGGFLDNAWGKNGVVRHNLVSSPAALAVQPDGKVVVAGSFGNHVAVVRLLASGSVDTSFGNAGRLELPAKLSSTPTGIAVDSHGRIVVVGTTVERITITNPDGGAPSYRDDTYLYATRATAAGRRDTTFGEQGAAVPGVTGEIARSVAIAPDDTILIGGSRPGASFAVWKLTASGNPDPTFGVAGRATIPVPNGVELRALETTDGLITVAGSATGARLDFAAAQMVVDGGAVGAFGEAGATTTRVGSLDDVAFAVAVQPDGKIVLGGETELETLRSPQFAVVRLEPNGALDGAFGQGGKVIVTFENTGVWKEVDERLRGLAIDSRGRIVVAGAIFEKTMPPNPDEFHHVGMLRLKPNGELDGLFAGKGKLTFTDANRALRGTALARGADGKLYVLGTVERIGGFFVARITP